MESSAKDEPVLTGIVLGNNPCNTKEAKWLCIENIYQKFYRSNFYDLGGTYYEDVADYWFLFKTETVGNNIFLLHLFVSSHYSGNINVSVSFANDLELDKKNPIAYLPRDLQLYKLKDCKELAHNYITTYNFSEVDVDALKDRSLYIAVSFTQKEDEGIQQDIIDNIKANHDFRALLTDPICSDFVVESADGEKFPVHKVMLSAHSEVFKAMLKEDTAESLNNFVKLVDVSTEDLRGILEFIYTGTLKDIENANFINLLMLADQYNLNGLRRLAQHALSQQLSVDNALEILIVADMYNADPLKQAAFKFIKRNIDCLRSSTFQEIKNADLIRELCEYIVLKP